MKAVCLITGAAGRLGRDLCRLLQADYQVVAIYRSTIPNIPSQIQRALPNEGGSNNNSTSAYIIQADLTRREEIKRVVEVTMARYGRIDALINAAADIKFHGKLRDLWHAGDYPQSQMHINSTVPVLLASAIYHYCWKAQPEENARQNRVIVNISSISGMYVFEERGQAFYGVSKAALNMLTLYLSLEFAPYNIRVNGICPSQFKGEAATRKVSEVVRELLGGDATGTIATKIP